MRVWPAAEHHGAPRCWQSVWTSWLLAISHGIASFLRISWPGACSSGCEHQQLLCLPSKLLLEYQSPSSEPVPRN